MLVRTSHQNENSEISLRPSPSVHPFRPHQNLRDWAFTSPAMAFYSQVSPSSISPFHGYRNLSFCLKTFPFLLLYFVKQK